MSTRIIGKPFPKGLSGNPGGRPRIVGTLRDMARAHAHEAIEELARLALKAKSETARIAAIRELLDRGYGKPPQFLAADDHKFPPDMTAAELRAIMIQRLEEENPGFRFVRVSERSMLPGPDEVVRGTALPRRLENS